jgi:DNA-3-methyladenine glycosylase
MNGPFDIRRELATDATTAAQRLLGCELIRIFPEGTVRVRIVETESYDQSDMASHSYGGESKRNRIMFGEAGVLYVYFTYGMHYCCNVVTGQDGEGSAVLIRAVEPVEGADILEHYRGKAGLEVTNGPAKLCQALGITKELNGHHLEEPPLTLFMKPPVHEADIVTTTRIGISKAAHELRRFYLRDNPYVSRR